MKTIIDNKGRRLEVVRASVVRVYWPYNIEISDVLDIYMDHRRNIYAWISQKKNSISFKGLKGVHLSKRNRVYFGTDMIMKVDLWKQS